MPRNVVNWTPVDCDELEQVHELLLEVDVVDGPPELRDIVADRWPELLHKVKPPLSDMH
jgi:hypothetical protein